MKLFSVVLALAGLAGGIMAQTPMAFMPYANRSLGVTYNGTVKVTPGEMFPPSSVATQPMFTYMGTNMTSSNSTYQILMVDLSILKTQLGGNGTYVNGLNSTRTTRIHFWGMNAKAASNGTFTFSTPALAPYQGPAPPATDIPHAYSFFLFNQPANYSVSAVYANLTNNANLRFNFSLPDLAAMVGPPLAGNYFLSGQNITMIMNSTSA